MVHKVKAECRLEEAAQACYERIIWDVPPKRRAMWGVFDHTGDCIETFPFTDRLAAVSFAQTMRDTAQFSDETFFVRMVKVEV